MLPIETVIDEQYGVEGPFRVYHVPEGEGLSRYALPEYRQPLSFDGNRKPLTYLQLAKNPSTRKFVPYKILYDATHYTDEQILSVPTLKNIGKTCSACQSRNTAEELIEGIDDSPASQLVQGADDMVKRYQRPVGQPKAMDIGSVITPSVIPAFIDVASQIFCQPLGVALLKLGSAGLASIAAGWAAEGGTQAAWREISEKIVSEYKICPTDVQKIQENIVAMKEAIDKDKNNILGAFAAGTMKNFKTVASEHGFEVSGQAMIGGKASMSISPLKRGAGRAID